MFFITAMNTILTTESTFDEAATEQSHCFGYFSDLALAKRIVENNYGDLFETKNTYVVIEEIKDGIHTDVSNSWWFKYNPELDRYDEIEVEPTGLTNYALG